MTIHNMKLFDQNFEDIKNGEKTREYRLNDEKRQKIKVGDYIEFRRVDNQDEKFFVQVVGLCIYKDFFSMYDDFFEKDFEETYDDIQSVVNDTYNFFTKEDERKYGGIIIKVKLVNDQIARLLV